MIEQFTYSYPKKEKTAFYASDYNKPSFDLFHKFIGTEETNPTTWKTLLRFGAGKGVEEAMLTVLKQNKIVNEDYDQNIHGRVDYDKHGIPIHGYIDAITTDGLPIEIKTINNNNIWDVKNYKDNKPRENYVGQLAIYMDFLGVSTGYLFVATIDGLQSFWFKCTREENIFTCGDVRLDLSAELNRWKHLYETNVLTKLEPDPYECLYKIPLDKIDWKSLSKNKIADARNNRAVIGDFEVSYSPFKTLWIQKQNASLGYTAEELIEINKLTEGYTTWK